MDELLKKIMINVITNSRSGTESPYLLSKAFLANINNPLDSDGNTALHLAYKLNKIDIVDKLKDLGADSNLDNKHGQKPMDMLKTSVLGGDIGSKRDKIKEEFVKILKMDHKMLNHLEKEHLSQINTPLDNDGNTLMHLAKLTGKDKHYKLLSELGASDQIKNKHGQTSEQVTFDPVKTLEMSIIPKDKVSEIKTALTNDKQLLAKLSNDSKLVESLIKGIVKDPKKDLGDLLKGKEEITKAVPSKQQTGSHVDALEAKPTTQRGMVK